MHKSVRRALAAVAVALTGIMVSQGNALAQAPHPRDVAIGTRLAARTDPAVQLIALVYAANVTVPSAKTWFGVLYGQAAKHAKAGRIPSDHQSMVKWVLRTAGANFDRYLSSTR